MTRVRLATDERRAQLLALGVDLFGRGAYDALTTDAIASAGGISKGLLFHYFGSKRGFYVATIEHVAQMLLDEVVLDKARAPQDAVLDAVERFLDFVLAHSAIYRALLRGGLGVDPQSQATVERVRWTIVHRVLELLDPSRGPVPDDPPPLSHTAGLRLYAW
ncbi:MAG: TetR/AcrR family transcriptional regulator, partial [Nannocystaceae bacterium]